MSSSTMYSMTGFGRAEITLEHRVLGVEIRGVNHRYSDIKVRLPPGWAQMENVLRSRMQEHIGRGRVEINVRWGNEALATGMPRLDKAVAAQYLQVHKELAEWLQQPESPLSVDQLFALPGVVTTEIPELPVEELKEPLLQILEEALQPFLRMRGDEGEHLRDVLTEQLKTLQRHVQQIELRLPSLVETQYQRLQERLAKWSLPEAVERTRLEQEIALAAERSDVSEELARMHSHIQQFEGLLLQGGVIGRRLDFLCQELHRETNTIGSKNQDIAIAQTLIAMKSTVDKLREQVQNIE